MKVKSSLNLTLKEKDSFRNETIKINIHRGKVYSKYIILSLIILSLIDIYICNNDYVTEFKFNNYLLMYLIMIGVNLLYLFSLKNMRICLKNLKVVDIIIGSYIIFMMVWGAIVSLMDQKLYGQIMVYMVSVIGCSVIYYVDKRKLLISYIVSISVLFLGLPFVQQSRDIVLGHYINGIIFLICAYVASRTLYKNLYNTFKVKSLIVEANERLKKEIEENKIINKQLKDTNKQLKKLSLEDELTNVYNRRALSQFIDNIFKHVPAETPISIIMIDIDNFKSYNDKYGHVNGDEVLKKISSKLNEAVKESKDFVARYGGEEFIYIALQTDENEIYEIANEIREKIYNLKITHEYSEVSKYVTVSLGIATVVPYNTTSIYECIQNADIALYKAKYDGKNRIAG